MIAEKERKDLMDLPTEVFRIVERSGSKGESSVAHQVETTVSAGHSVVMIEAATAGEEMMAALLMPAPQES